MKRSVRLLLCLLSLVLLAGCGTRNAKPNDTDPPVTGYTEGTDDPTAPEEPSTLTVYPEFDERIQRDYLYSVSVTQGDKTAALPVYNHTEASRTTRSSVDTTADAYRRFSTFAFDPAGGGVRVDIKVNSDFESYSVIPSAKAFRNEFYRGVISVYLDQPDYFMIRLNGKDSTLLAVFADEPETEVPKPGLNTIIIDGWHEVDGGLLELKKKGTTLYIKPGAVLNARVKITADDCRVIGRGAILDPFSDIYRYDEKKAGDYVLLFIKDADNVTVDGIHLLNARCFNLEIQGAWGRSYADNTLVTNTKVLSTQMSSDGFMFNGYVRDAWAKHCFIYCGDNALNYEDGSHFKDILVGTTCNAIFPQTDIRDSSLEDIYVFRADDNIINPEYNGTGGQTVIENSTITNLYAQDVTYTNYFLFIENKTDPVISNNGGFVIKNVYLPALDGIRRMFYQNVVPGNYQVTLSNVSVGGRIVQSINLTHDTNSKRYTGYAFGDDKWGWIGYGDTHEFSYTLTDDFTAGVTAHKATVNYKNELNVLVGSYAVYYSLPVLREGDGILLPLEQTRRELRTGNTAETVERNGIPYVRAGDLVSSGMAKDVQTDGNRLILTPNDPKGNLILQDTGILSQFTEMRASHMEVTAKADGSTMEFHVTGNRGNKSDVIGLHCLLNEAIKKYGAGNYRLTFRLKSDRMSQITAAIGYGSEATVYKSAEYTVGLSYQEFTLDFGISRLVLEQPQIRLTFTGDWAKVYEFDLRDVRLTKGN